MIRVVPPFVQAGIRDYDSALRLTWSPLARQFVLQRRIINAQTGSYDALMVTLDRRIGRLSEHQARLATALANDPVTDIEATVLNDALKRVAWSCMDSGVRLEALKEGYLFVYWVPPPTANESWAHRLRCILYTLQQNDIVASGGADKVHAEGLDQDRAERTRAERKRQRIFRDGAGEVYDDIQRKTGERILLGANLHPPPQEPLIVTGG